MDPRISAVAGHPYNLPPSDRVQMHQHLHVGATPAKDLPASIVVARPPAWPLWMQGNLGCCCEHGVLKATLFVLWKKYGIASTTMLARLFAYYNGRAMEGAINEDSGLSLLDGITSVEKYGAALESFWPYDVARFKEKPPVTAYTDGRTRLVIAKRSLPPTFDGIRQGLNSGFPVIIGTMLKESFEDTPRTGVVPVPAPSEKDLGGHCMLAWEAHTHAAMEARAAEGHAHAASWLSDAAKAIGRFITGKHQYGQQLGPIMLENWWGKNFGDSGYIYEDGSIANRDLFDAWQITDVEIVTDGAERASLPAAA